MSKHYLIDGYNLFFFLSIEHDPFEKSRNTFIEDLETLLASFKDQITVIFDSSFDHAELYPQTKVRNNLEIVYSPQYENADDYIIEILSFSSSPQSHIVVTSDKLLSQHVKQVGAKVISLAKFLSIVKKKNQKFQHPPQEKQIQKETEKEFKRLLKIFEQKLDKPE